MPVGFRFRPTEEELVGHYLRHKLLADDPSTYNTIPEIEVCHYEPWELPAAVSAISLNTLDDPEWFFFSPRHYKNSHGTRFNRATSRGYWKATGKDRNISDRVPNNVMGTKKTLVFYDHGTNKTSWVIHEYHDALFHPNQRTHVICKLLKNHKNKAEENTDELVYNEIEPNDRIATEYENPAPMQQNKPVGFRFSPTDEELVGHYLRHKLLADYDSIHDTVPEIDVCKYEPCQLPAAVSALSMNKSDDPEWFFFSPRDYKYYNSTRFNRATSCGYWKATGKDRNISDRVTNNVMGTKKSLVFYDHGINKTDWVIHEYHDALFHPNQRTHVLCKLLKKYEKKTEENRDELVYDESEPNDRMATEYENPENVYTNPEVQYFTYMEDSMMTQTPLESDEFEGSMIQTPHQEVDSTTESEEFDFRSFLRSSPRRDDE